MDNETRVILITGGSSGIGKALAARLLENSQNRVAICGRDLAKLESAIAELEPDGSLFHAVQADVTRSEDVAQLVEMVRAKFGKIDVLVNSAGVGHLGPFLETDEETMHRLWAVNVQGAMRVTQAVLPDMVARKAGHIVNLCGILGIKTIPNAASYCATKHALVGFGNALAQELKRSGIRITSMCCTGVDTPFWQGIPSKPRPEMLLTADDVAGDILRLLDQPAHLVTTQVVLQHVAHQLA